MLEDCEITSELVVEVVEVVDDDWSWTLDEESDTEAVGTVLTLEDVHLEDPEMTPEVKPGHCPLRGGLPELVQTQVLDEQVEPVMHWAVVSKCDEDTAFSWDLPHSHRPHSCCCPNWYRNTRLHTTFDKDFHDDFHEDWFRGGHRHSKAPSPALQDGHTWLPALVQSWSRTTVHMP